MLKRRLFANSPKPCTFRLLAYELFVYWV
jgi:hypothetical protein